MLPLYITKESFSKFLFEFYLTFKLGKGKLYNYNEMTNFVYYFFVILFFGTFLGALFLFDKFIKKNNKNIFRYYWGYICFINFVIACNYQSNYSY